MSILEDQLLNEAKQVVHRLERESKRTVDPKSGTPKGFVDPNWVDGQLAAMGPSGSAIHADDVRARRMGELARAYAKISDGAGGEIQNVRAKTAFNNVLRGLTSDGKAYTLSQREALRLGGASMQYVTAFVREKQHNNRSTSSGPLDLC